MSFIGGIIGVVVSVIIYLTLGPSALNGMYPVREGLSEDKKSLERILSVFDAMIPIVPLGIFFGRF